MPIAKHLIVEKGGLNAYKGKMGRSVKQRIEDMSVPEPNTGCWLWLGSLTRFGYGDIKVKEKQVKAHRSSFEVFKGPIPAGMHVCHSCDQRSCVNPDHLFLGSNQDNMNDMKRKGRQGRRKLTDSEVIQITKLFGIMSDRQIASMFSVARETVNAIRHGKNFSHLTGIVYEGRKYMLLQRSK